MSRMMGTGKTSVVRLTLVVPKEMDENIELLRLLTQASSKNELIKAMIAKRLKDEGLDPDISPNGLLRQIVGANGNMEAKRESAIVSKPK